MGFTCLLHCTVVAITVKYYVEGDLTTAVFILSIHDLFLQHFMATMLVITLVESCYH
jgi:hypothetical protein